MSFLWYEKYRPQKFSELTFHSNLGNQLQNLASSKNMPHIIFYGPDGSGKTTRMNCLLQHIYGQSVTIPKKDTYRIKHRSFFIELPIKYTKNHVELSPSDLKQRDSILLNKFIKDCAENQSVIFDGEKKNDFLTIVLHKAEKLSLNAQAALRRSLEKYAQKIRVIMLCQTTGSLIPAIKSRCLLLRVPAPNNQEIYDCLDHIAKQQNFKNPELMKQIGENCNGNLRAAILLLQSASLNEKLKASDLKEKWKVRVEQAVDKIFQSQQTGSIKELRSIFYELLSNNISCDVLLKQLLVAFLERLNESQKKIAVKAKFAAMDVQCKLQQGSKDIIYLELLSIKLMRLVKDN